MIPLWTFIPLTPIISKQVKSHVFSDFNIEVIMFGQNIPWTGYKIPKLK